MYRWMIAAPASGSGKTAAVCGLLTLLKKRGCSAGAFKCGPDYIDPMFHKKVLGIPGCNLDSFFLEPEQLRDLFCRETAELEAAVVEGVMGYFDGVGGMSWGSSWDIARILKLPVILVVDGHGASLSVLAQIKGFLDYQPTGEREENRIAGVILNRTSPSMCSVLKPRIEKELGIACLGCIPVLKWLDLKSRHLGLLLPDEIGNLQEQMERLSQVLEESVDVERLLELGRGPQRRHESGADQEDGAGREDEAGREDRAGRKKKQGEETFCLAAAMDEAFCFYYQENLELLREMGARIIPFSPLRDEKLPEQTDGILLGGGYPELYAGELGKNFRMRESIRRAAEEGMPILGECGGYLYLLEELEGEDGNMYPMAGVFSGSGKREERLRHFGYVTVQTGADSSYLKKGQQIRGHEFHYWHCQKDETEGEMEAEKPLGGRKWPAMRVKYQVTAGFPHLYYPSLPEFAERFARACMEYGQRRNRQ